MAKLQIKRVYELKARGDGQRVLIDRIWPRGIRKEALSDALWLKEIAPSTALRRWFGHRPERWNEFRRRYWIELDQAQAPVEKLQGLTRKGTVTLLYAARDSEHNQAVALRDYLEQQKR